MAQMILTLPDNKVAEVLAAFKDKYPMMIIPDPEWVDPGDGSEAPLVNEFSDVQWARECVKNFVRTTHRDHKFKLAKEAVLLDDHVVE